jgi:hypothetical protein
MNFIFFFIIIHNPPKIEPWNTRTNESFFFLALVFGLCEYYKSANVVDIDEENLLNTCTLSLFTKSFLRKTEVRSNTVGPRYWNTKL